jgi:hypothetical protein
MGARDPNILHQGLLIASFFQGNAQIDASLRTGDLAPVAKTHFLIEFILLKYNIREVI